MRTQKTVFESGIQEKSDCSVVATPRNNQKLHKLVFMNVDDLHFWRRRRGGQGVFFGIKKGGEEFFSR